MSWRKDINNSIKTNSTAIIIVLITTVLTGGTVLSANLDVLLPAPGALATSIDNPFLLLPVGLIFVYMAETQDDRDYNKLTITGSTENVAGYTTLIDRDQE